MGTHVFHINSDAMVDKGLKFIYRMVALELREYGFDKLVFPTDPITFEDIEAYREFLSSTPTFITVHYTTIPLEFKDSGRPIVPGALGLKPHPLHFRYADMGKQLTSHYMVAGSINCGKTVIAEVLKKALEQFAPEAKIYLIDIDDHSYPFYSHTNQEERDAHLSYIKTLEHVFGKSPLDPIS